MVHGPLFTFYQCKDDVSRLNKNKLETYYLVNKVVNYVGIYKS